MKPASVSLCREGLEKAVREQLMSDVPLWRIASGRFGQFGHFCHCQALCSPSCGNGWKDGGMVASASFLCYWSGGAPIWPRHVKWLISSVPCTMKFTTPFRKVSTHSGCDLLHWDLRCNDSSSFYTYVSCWLVSSRVWVSRWCLAGRCRRNFGGYLYFHKAPMPTGFPWRNCA